MSKLLFDAMTSLDNSQLCSYGGQKGKGVNENEKQDNTVNLSLKMFPCPVYVRNVFYLFCRGNLNNILLLPGFPYSSAKQTARRQEKQLIVTIFYR